MSSSASCAKCLFQFTLNSESLDISNNQVYCAQCWTVFRNEQLDQAQLPAQLCWSENLPSKGSLSRTGQGSTSPRRWEHATNAAAVAVDAVAAAPAAEAAAEADKMPAAASVQPAGPGPSAKRRLARKATVAKEAKAAAKAADAKAAEAEDDDNAIADAVASMCIRCACGFTGEGGQAQGSPRSWGEAAQGQPQVRAGRGKEGRRVHCTPQAQVVRQDLAARRRRKEEEAEKGQEGSSPLVVLLFLRFCVFFLIFISVCDNLNVLSRKTNNLNNLIK